MTSSNSSEKEAVEMHDGCIVAYCAKGAQDELMKRDHDIFNAYNQFVKGIQHQVVYRPIPTSTILTKEDNTVTFSIRINANSPDICNMIDLVFPLNLIMTTMSHGFRNDSLCCDDVKTEIETNAILFKRRISVSRYK